MCSSATIAAANSLRESSLREFRYRSQIVATEQDGSFYVAVPILDSPEEQAALCFFLLGQVSEALLRAPLACDELAISAVRDSLSSLAEFPGVNQR